MRVHLFALCWNEEKILPCFFKHYQDRFRDIQFTIYDNGSTDASQQIIREHGGEVIHYDTNGTIRGDIQARLKNEIWKSSTADWIIVCDIDEWIDCDDAFLKSTPCTVVKTEGYNMVAHTRNLNKVVRGARHIIMDKCLLFKREAISHMNYGPGGHLCKPEGKVIYNAETVKMYHMKFFHLGYHLKRQKLAAARVSEYNKRQGWSKHYYSDARKSIAYYLYVWLKSKKIRTKNQYLPTIENRDLHQGLITKTSSRKRESTY
jgi:glycosyltransferase involved in cell wall biosynthesis